MKYLLLIITVILLTFYSCQIGCGDDILIATLKISPVSQSFIPYSGDEILTFKDHDGKKFRLTSERGITTNTFLLIENQICEGLDGLDWQNEYYDHEYQQIVFTDDLGNKISLGLSIDYVYRTRLDALIIYERLLIDADINRLSSTAQLLLCTNELQGNIPDNYKNFYATQTRFIGDTILHDNAYQDIYEGSFTDSRIYFSKNKGVILISRDDKFWILEE